MVFTKSEIRLTPLKVVEETSPVSGLRQGCAPFRDFGENSLSAIIRRASESMARSISSM
jgi:hypothetical protein